MPMLNSNENTIPFIRNGSDFLNIYFKNLKSILKFKFPKTFLKYAIRMSVAINREIKKDRSRYDIPVLNG
jgi:hypothetical protein